MMILSKLPVNLKNQLRLFLLQKAHANIIVTGQWGTYRAQKSGRKIWHPKSGLWVSDSFTANLLSNIYENFNGGIGNSANADWPQTLIPGWALNSYPAVIKTTTGPFTSYIAPMNIYALSGDATHGIIYSTDGTALTPTDYALPGAIAHGVGAGQLSYLHQQASQPLQIVNANQVMFELYRAVTNNSGATINVQKIFLVMGTSPYFLIFEDLNSNAILNGQTTGARYQFITQV